MLSSLFGKRKKSNFRVQCDLTKEPLQKESTYAITTADIVASKKFWDNKMTEPDTLSYTLNHFKSGDQTATQIRKMIFQKYTDQDKVWFISDSQLHLFDVDVVQSKKLADEYWENKGELKEAEVSNSLKQLGEEVYEEFKAYAIMYAGKKQVAAQL